MRETRSSRRAYTRSAVAGMARRSPLSWSISRVPVSILSNPTTLEKDDLVRMRELGADTRSRRATVHRALVAVGMDDCAPILVQARAAAALAWRSASGSAKSVETCLKFL